jgi:alpha-L-fucosidase 2
MSANLSRIFFVLLAFLCLTDPISSRAQSFGLWYTKPAQKWTDALPIGNGRLGAMIYGGIEQDKLQFNEETLWSGSPRNYDRAGASSYLPMIRKLLFEGKQKEAETLAQANFMGLQSEAGDRTQWVKHMKAGKGIVGNPALPTFDDRLWQTIAVPAYEGWEAVGLPNLDGAVWFRTTFEVPANWKDKSLVLDLNRIRDQDFTYINGVLVGDTDNSEPRKYLIPAKLIKVGRNSIAIQVLNYFDKGGLAGYKDTAKKIGIYPEGENMETGVSLVKKWKYHIQNSRPPAVAQYQASYQPFGDLVLNFKHKSTNFTNYKRTLALATATATTTYTCNGVNYQREYLASAAHQAVVVHLTADKAKAINLTVGLSSPHQGAIVKKVDPHTLSIFVKVKDGVLKGEARLAAAVKNGSIKIVNQKLQIINADEVTLYLTAGTNFINNSDVSGDPILKKVKVLKLIYPKKYSEISAAHIKSHQQLFNAFHINFGKSANEELPTDQRIEKFATSNDPALVALYVQYGRYLLISSSRPGTQPANLQGIWNDQLAPPWGSKYTTNINLEMNYWPTEVLNLPTLNEPLFKKINALASKGAHTAKTYYNARGWVLHHNTDLWNGTAPINNASHGIWVTGGAWLSHHLWQHYLFSKDKKFLEKEAYPIMKQAALFFEDFLIKDPKTGWLISTPSNSPENGGLVAGPTMDHQLIRSLFESCIDAADILKIDEQLKKSLQEKLKLLAPNQIGKYGQLQEWLTDLDDTTNKHRHVSHLWGVYPGNDITWEKDPKLMNAAKQSLLYRGDEATGWSLAWKINFWARFKAADHAFELIKLLIKPATANGAGSYINLFDAHPPFQIDGNFGGAAGIAELILQSHETYIELLPALPSAIPFGEVKGIRARGGFELEVNWEERKLKHVTVKSTVGGICKLRYLNNQVSFDTKAGEIYQLNGLLK